MLIKYAQMIGVTGKIIRLFRMSMRDTKATVMGKGRTSKEFTINTRIRYFDGLLAVVFNMLIWQLRDW